MITYELIDNGDEITLSVSGVSDSLCEKIAQRKTITYSIPEHTLILNASGENFLESNFGSTTLYISYKGWNELSVTLSGYVKEDRDIYSERINAVMGLLNG